MSLPTGVQRRFLFRIHLHDLLGPLHGRYHFRIPASQELIERRQQRFFAGRVFNRPDTVSPDVYLIRKQELSFFEGFLFLYDLRTLRLLFFGPFSAQDRQLIGKCCEFPLDGSHLPVKHHGKFAQFENNQGRFSEEGIGAGNPAPGAVFES
jgi:hypothetical protein